MRGKTSHSDSAFSIDGTVRDNSDQHGMENIRVDLRQPDGSPVSSTFTQADGVFEFTGVANGEYILEINAQNYEPLQQSVAIANSARRGVTLFLTRASIQLNSNVSGAVISAHQLSVPRKAQDEFNKGMNFALRQIRLSRGHRPVSARHQGFSRRITKPTP